MHFTNEQMAFTCLISTLIAILPSSIHLLFNPRKEIFLLSLINSSLAFFLFSFQVIIFHSNLSFKLAIDTHTHKNSDSLSMWLFSLGAWKIHFTRYTASHAIFPIGSTVHAMVFAHRNIQYATVTCARSVGLCNGYTHLYLFSIDSSINSMVNQRWENHNATAMGCAIVK